MHMKTLFLTITAVVAVACNSIDVEHVNNDFSRIRLEKGQTVVLPVSDSAPDAFITLNDKEGVIGVPWTVKLAVDNMDYSIPFTADRDMIMEVRGLSFESLFYKKVRLGRARMVNPRPYLHYKPAYGWTNDPNGMVYKDGEWHLYFQWNPFGALWNNMTWGHAVSKDLLHWEQRPMAITPDSLGMIFSGSAVVKDDKIVAMYTSAGKRQSQSIAVSDDGGNTFVKSANNPVLVSERPDFRDPKVFWYEPEGKWCVIVAAGDAMEIYSSPDMEDWTFESRFGEGAGCHGGVWECPDFFPLDYQGSEKWVMIVNCNRNDEIGTATQYFIGSFDGHTFTPDDVEERWLDYGRDHYAAVTWSNAPDNRRVLLAWMSNWQYAHLTTTRGYRGMMCTPRELSLGEYDGRMMVRAYPVKEVLDNVRKSCLIASKITYDNPVLEISGMTLKFDFAKDLCSVQRGEQTVSTSVERRTEHDVLVVSADGAIECFIDGGFVCMSFISL